MSYNSKFTYLRRLAYEKWIDFECKQIKKLERPNRAEPWLTGTANFDGKIRTDFFHAEIQVQLRIKIMIERWSIYE